MNPITNFLANFVTTGPDGVTPGLATTEFLATVVSAAVVLFGLNLPADRKAALVTLLGIAYTVARSVVKALAKPPAPPAITSAAPTKI